MSRSVGQRRGSRLVRPSWAPGLPHRRASGPCADAVYAQPSVHIPLRTEVRIDQPFASCECVYPGHLLIGE